MSLLIYPTECKEYFEREFSQRKLRSSSYSKRAFARDLNLAPSTLIEFFKGRPSISKDRVKELGIKIKLDSHNLEHLLDLYLIAFSKTSTEVNLAKSRIELRKNTKSSENKIERFKLASEPIYWIYLELLTINPKIQNIDFAAKALGVSSLKLKKINRKLIDLGFLILDDKGQIKPTDKFRFFGDERQNFEMRKFHKNILKSAISSVDKNNPDERFLSSVIFSFPKSKFKELVGKLENAN